MQGIWGTGRGGPGRAGAVSAPLLIEAKDGHEGFLGDVYVADALHAFFAFGLLLEELALAADVAAVALREDVLAHRADRLAGDDAAADRGLQRHIEHLARDERAEFFDEAAALHDGFFAMRDQREGIDGGAVDEDLELRQR